jgi:hypothetical protein
MEPQVRYHIHKSLPLVPIQSQINIVKTHRNNFCKIHFNIIFPSTPMPFNGLFSQVFSPQPYMHLSTPPICVMCPTHLVLLDFISETMSICRQTVLMAETYMLQKGVGNIFKPHILFPVICLDITSSIDIW